MAEPGRASVRCLGFDVTITTVMEERLAVSGSMVLGGSSVTGSVGRIVADPVVGSLAAADVMLRNALKSNVVNMSNKKLNELVYFAHGWHLGHFSVPLVQDELAEVGTYGPVFLRLYYNVSTRLDQASLVRSSPILDPDFFKEFRVKITDRSLGLINHVSSIYHRYTASDLVKLTHRPNSPWSRAHDKELDTIPNESIAAYYSRLFKIAKEKS